MTHRQNETARILTLSVGGPKQLGTRGAPNVMDRPWESSIFKTPTTERVQVHAEHIAGDSQADTKHHGGPDKAICVYPAAHYAYWAERLDRELDVPAFGENICVTGQDEASVYLGDVYRVGSALVQISQPRSPCWKLARRWRHKQLALWVQQTGFTGWYLRVLEEGSIQRDDALELVERPAPELSIERVNVARYGEEPDAELLERLSTSALLSSSWREALARRLAKLSRYTHADETERLVGENSDA